MIEVSENGTYVKMMRVAHELKPWVSDWRLKSIIAIWSWGWDGMSSVSHDGDVKITISVAVLWTVGSTEHAQADLICGISLESFICYSWSWSSKTICTLSLPHLRNGVCIWSLFVSPASEGQGFCNWMISLLFPEVSFPTIHAFLTHTKIDNDCTRPLCVSRFTGLVM